jgi:hypothetical protein
VDNTYCFEYAGYQEISANKKNLNEILNNIVKPLFRFTKYSMQPLLEARFKKHSKIW